MLETSCSFEATILNWLDVPILESRVLPLEIHASRLAVLRRREVRSREAPQIAKLLWRGELFTALGRSPRDMFRGWIHRYLVVDFFVDAVK